MYKITDVISNESFCFNSTELDAIRKTVYNILERNKDSKEFDFYFWNKSGAVNLDDWFTRFICHRHPITSERWNDALTFLNYYKKNNLPKAENFFDKILTENEQNQIIEDLIHDTAFYFIEDLEYFSEEPFYKTLEDLISIEEIEE